MQKKDQVFLYIKDEIEKISSAEEKEILELGKKTKTLMMHYYGNGEIEKPFAKEEELRAKTARLDELNILLNMDKKENEIVGGEPDEGEAVGGRKEKSYER